MPLRLAVPIGIFAGSFLTAAACASFDDSAANGERDAATDGSAQSDVAVADDGSAPDASEASVSALYRDAVLAAGPVGYWRMGRLVSSTLVPNEASDASPLVVSAVRTDEPGIFEDDRAMAFDGVNAYAEATASELFEFNGKAPFSIELWARHDGRLDGGSLYEPVLAFIDGPPGNELQNGYLLYLTNDMPPYMAGFRDSPDAEARQAEGPSAAAGIWAHYVLTFDGSQVRMYVDGQPKGTRATEAHLTPRPSKKLTVGRGSNDARGFHGTLDEIAIYAKELDAITIANHYDLGRPR